MIGMSAVHCQMANGIIVVITTEPYHTFMHGMGMDPACSLGFEALGMQTDRRAWNKITTVELRQLAASFPQNSM